MAARLNIFTQICLVGLLSLGATAAAADELDLQAPTLWVDAWGGYSIYKSELVKSNDTSTTIGYGFGVNAGTERNWGFFHRREQSTFAFTLVESSMAVNWQDTIFRYRLGPVYLGLVLAQTQWLVSVPPVDDVGTPTGDTQEFFDVQASGYGANVGFQMPLSGRSMLYLDTVYSSTPTSHLKARTAEVPDDVPAPEEVLVGTRMALDIGGSLNLTKRLLQGMAGFKYRTYNLSVDGTSYAEQHHTTYLGLRCSWSF